MSVVGAALVPAAPVLVPSLGGLGEPALDVRQAALQVIRRLIAVGPDLIIALAEAEPTGLFDDSAAWDLHRLGGMRSVAEPGASGTFGEPLPVSLAIGASMLRDAGWTGPTSFHALERTMSTTAAIDLGHQLAATPRSVGLLLLGNGSACCTDKAPGSLHPQAGHFNEALVAMIRKGDQRAMGAITVTAATEQLSDIRLPLQVFAGAVGDDRFLGSIECSREFSGVHYVCAALRPSTRMAGVADDR